MVRRGEPSPERDWADKYVADRRARNVPQHGLPASLIGKMLPNPEQAQASANKAFKEAERDRRRAANKPSSANGMAPRIYTYGGIPVYVSERVPVGTVLLLNSPPVTVPAQPKEPPMKFQKTYPRAFVRRTLAKQWAFAIVQKNGVRYERKAVFVSAAYAGQAAANAVTALRPSAPASTTKDSTTVATAKKAASTKAPGGTCKECGRPMRNTKTTVAQFPGTVLRQSAGLCQSDYQRIKKENERK